MKIILYHRSYGIHTSIKNIEIKGSFNDYCTLSHSKLVNDYNVDEDKLLNNIPKGFLPVSPRKCLLTVGDKDGSTGQIGLDKFLSWSKYFDSYVLELEKDTIK